MLAKFPSLLAKLIEQAFHIRPVETNLRRARTELVGLQQRRHRRRDSRENRRYGVFPPLPSTSAVCLLSRFFRSSTFSASQLRFTSDRGIRLRVTEHVRMPVHQLARKPVQNVINGKCSLLLRHLRIKKHLQQQVAKFAGKFLPVAIVDGFENFVSLFQRVRLDGIESLLAIPGATPGSPQAFHDSDCAFETFAGRRHLATTLNEPSRNGQCARYDRLIWLSSARRIVLGATFLAPVSERFEQSNATFGHPSCGTKVTFSRWRQECTL